MIRRVVAVVVATSLACALGCSSKDADSDNGAGNGGSSVAGAGGAGAGMAGSSVAAGGTGGGGTSGTGGASAGKGGASTGGAGNSAGASQAGNGQAGSSTEGVGYECAYTDLSSKLSGEAYDSCLTGYCLWDGRYFGDSYCTIACSGAGATCPDGFTCTQDQETSTKYWCALNPPTAPTDLGAMCSSQYVSDCTGSQARQNFCLAPAVDSCENDYCVYDGVTKSAY
ncbi:MAG TPA: hypothetical protein VGP93_17005, partial [Polyangiaceae bacterium]|nr:hypothetical protein [Polyangiaceae bacterium]